MSVRCGSKALRRERRGADRCVRSRHMFYMPVRYASHMRFVLTRSRNTISDVTQALPPSSLNSSLVRHRADFDRNIPDLHPIHSRPGKTEGR